MWDIYFCFVGGNFDGYDLRGFFIIFYVDGFVVWLWFGWFWFVVYWKVVDWVFKVRKRWGFCVVWWLCVV